MIPVYTTFTVTNNTPNPIQFTPSIESSNASPSTLAITGGSCRNNTVPAHRSCIIDVTVTAGVCPDVQTIDASLIVVPDINQATLSHPFTVTVTATNFLLIASGVQLPSTPFAPITGTPVLTVHNSAGNWTTKTVSGVTNGIFNSSTCSGNSPTSTCVAVGQDSSSGANTLLFVSRDGGVTWAVPSSIANFPMSAHLPGTLYGVGCDESPLATRCWAVGQITDNTGTTRLNVGAIILSTTDGGATWTAQNPPAPPVQFAALSSNSVLYSAACNSTQCFAAGVDPRTIASADAVGGFVTTATTLTAYSATGATVSFTDTDCAGSVCLATGPIISGVTPSTTGAYLMVSSDSGNSFSNVQLTSDTSNEYFMTGVACAELTSPNTKVLCAAVGAQTPNVTGPFSPIIFYNDNVLSNPTGGWGTATTSPASPSGPLSSVACTPTIDGTKVSCIATGGNGGGSSVPALVLSITGTSLAGNWVQSSTAGDGIAMGSACIPDGANIACAISGSVPGAMISQQPTPFLELNIDSSTTWSPVTSTPAIPTNACYSNAGAHGSSTGALFYSFPFVPFSSSSVCNLVLP